MLTVQEIIKNQVTSTEQFPVDFDAYWQWLGYSKKENAKRAFLNSDFEKGFDFELLISEELRPQGGSSNRKFVRLPAFKNPFNQGN